MVLEQRALERQRKQLKESEPYTDKSGISITIDLGGRQVGQKETYLNHVAQNENEKEYYPTQGQKIQKKDTALQSPKENGGSVKISLDLSPNKNPIKGEDNSANFNNLGGGDSSLLNLGNISLESSSLVYPNLKMQNSSIHDVHPAPKMSINKTAKQSKGFKPQANNVFQPSSITSSAPGGPQNIISQTSHTFAGNEDMKQITINNNINITTIHNGSANPHTQGTSALSSSKLLHQSISNGLNRMNKSVSAIFSGKQKNSNLNLLLQNPLS